MRKRLAVILLAFLMVFGASYIGTDVQAFYKAKSKSVSKKTKKSSSRLRAGVRRRGGSRDKFAANRASARRRAAAYRRAALARAHAVDNRLLNTTTELITEDDVSGEDPEMRQIAVDALAGRPGTVVLLDPNTGRVYSIVNQKWALAKPFKPCSTIKLITSIAALGEGLVDPDLEMEVAGGEDINMINALARSNNEYFQELGEQLGFEQVINYAREWGLGELTGINLDGESPGYLPGHKDERAVPRMCSHGDDIGITAIQLAVLTAAIANGGNLYQPQILRTDEERRDFKPILVRKIDFAEKDRQKIIEGMRGAVAYGTARRSGAASLNVVGKTGSCNGTDSKLGLFASFTSPDNPELVTVVISTGSSQRGSLSAIVSGEIYSHLADRLNKAARPRRVHPTVLDTTVEKSSDK